MSPFVTFARIPRGTRAQSPIPAPRRARTRSAGTPGTRVLGGDGGVPGVVQGVPGQDRVYRAVQGSTGQGYPLSSGVFLAAREPEDWSGE